MIVALDIDGVLRDLMQQFVKKYNENEGANKSVTDLVLYNTARDLCGNFEDFVGKLEKWDCFRGAPAYARSLEFVYSLLCFVDVVYVTSQVTLKSRIDTMRWLRDNTFPLLDTHFCRDKTRVNYDIIVEDSIGNAETAIDNGRFSVLMDRPWTQGYSGEVPVVLNYDEAFLYIKKVTTTVSNTN